MGAGIPANGTSSDDSYLPTHTFPLAFLAADDATGPPRPDISVAQVRRIF
jgi:hypothetical protein